MQELLAARRYAYKLGAVTIVPNESAVIEFDDPTFTGAAEAAGTWMIGPPVPAVEQDSCPPPKILGRKIARVLWQHGGKEAHLKQVMVQVHGTVGVDQVSWVRFSCEAPRLDLPWAGDPLNLQAKP